VVFDHCMDTLPCPYAEGSTGTAGWSTRVGATLICVAAILNVLMLYRNRRVLRLREVRDQWVKVLAVCTLEHENFEKWSCC